MKYLTSRWSVLVTGMILAAISPAAAAVPEASWQAQWLGAAAAARVDLAGASWIWAPEAGVEATRNAPAGSRFFRREIDLPGTAPVTAAAARFAADNHFTLVINGKEVGRGDDWQRPRAIDITAELRPGANRIVVRAENDPAAGAINAAGLIGKIRIERKDGTSQEIATDASWVTAETVQSADWKSAQVLGTVGTAPWSAIEVAPMSTPANQWNGYRKSFALPEKPATAYARIAVDSKYWLWVNGKLVVYEGGLKRGPTPQDTYFDRVDLAPYLRKGGNTIAVLAWYWGKDGYSHKSSGKAGFLFEMQAGATTVLSDTSWKMIRHPAYGVTGEPHPNYRMPDANIHFDARLDLGAWTMPEFNDTSWAVPVTCGQPPAAPWNRLVERPIPLWRMSGLMPYENAREIPRFSDGKPIIARLPRNLTISPFLKIKAPAGLTIGMRTDNYKGGSEYNYRSEYVTKEGVQEFESLAYLNGHWMIYAIPAGVEILELRYRETRYDTDFTGVFECDDPFLNKLWLKCRTTMNVNMRDAIQDPDRERSQWWGDAAIVLGEILHACDLRGQRLIRKAILNLADWQKPDGVLYSPVPAGSWDKELPGQMLSSIGRHGFWYYYLYSGDQATIAQVYPAVKRYLALWQLGPDGLLVHRSGGWDWGDWGENIDRPVLDNPLLYQALGAAVEMAKATGNDADIPAYQAMMASLEANYNRMFWKGNEYRSPGYNGKTDDRGHGLAALYGLAKPEQWPAIKAVFNRSFEASPYMEKYILESLFRMGDSEAALARMKSRYKKMVDSECSTLWEGWGIGPEGYGGGSYNHGWSGGPLTLMTECVAGIAPTTPGFATYDVRPQLGPLKCVRAGFDTVKGRIEVVISRAPGAFSLKLASPAQSSARVCIPVTEYGLKSIRVNGVRVWNNGIPAGHVKGVTPADGIPGHACFTVASGRWEFEGQ
jgi:hypothetical protein